MPRKIGELLSSLLTSIGLQRLVNDVKQMITRMFHRALAENDYRTDGIVPYFERNFIDIYVHMSDIGLYTRSGQFYEIYGDSSVTSTPRMEIPHNQPHNPAQPASLPVDQQMTTNPASNDNQVNPEVNEPVLDLIFEQCAYFLIYILRRIEDIKNVCLHWHQYFRR